MRKQYYEDNKQQEIDRVAARRKKIAEYIAKLKKQLFCVRCGESHTATLHFHHKDPTLKSFTISQAPTRGLSKALIDLEIEKCEPLCANCHAKEHFNNKAL